MGFVSKNFNSWLYSSLVFVLIACGGGSCGGCESCGVAPIPGGYPIADRIDNSAQVRLTSSGIAFIEDNIGDIVTNFVPGGLDFAIPATSGSTTGVDYSLCPDGDCRAHGEIDDMRLDPVPANRLHAELDIILDSREATGMRRAIPVRLRGLCVLGVCAINTTCQADIDTRRGSRPTITLGANVDFNEETEAARAGYTRVDVSDADLVSGADIEDADITFGSCSGISGAIINALSSLLRGLLIDQLQDQVGSILNDTINDQLCTTQGEYGCPTGTVADGTGPDAVCRYSAGGRCVPILLGTDGQGDLGQAFLGGISPGTHAPGQFLLAAGGEGEAVNMGMTLDFYGGWRSTDLSFTTSPAHNPCVPVIDPPAFPTIPEAAIFRGNTTPGGTDAHVGIGLAESFLNHAGYGMFDGGMLCIGAGTRTSQQISTGLFSILIPSIANVAYPESPAPISLAIRPQLPPNFEVGEGSETDALLTITLPEVEIDFYVWSTERYVRILTYKADLSIPVNLVVADGAIQPQIVSVTALNSEVTNSELLSEDPASLATLLQDVISMFAGMLTGSLSPFELPDLMGFELTVPEGGITNATEGSEEFLGIFANLAVAPPPSMLTATVDTSATLESLELDKTVLALDTYGEGELPTVRIGVTAEGPLGVEYEHSYRIDQMNWSAWTRESVLTIQSRAFLLQARHEIEVRSRVVGEPLSADESPATVEVLIDGLAPDVRAHRLDGGVSIEAFDVLTSRSHLEVRTRVDDEAWTDWQPMPDTAFIPLADDDARVDVEVRDEAGNVGAARSALIRGLPDPTAEGGCNCDVPGGSDGTSPLLGLGLLVAFGALVRRRRSQRRRSLKTAAKKIAKPLATLLVFGVAGCDCGDGMMMMPPAPCMDACTAAVPPMTAGSICCEATDMCVSYDLATLCEPGFLCSGPSALVLDEACGVTCNDCVEQPPLEPGELATYLDMDVADDGSVVFSGYSPGIVGGRRYGDLVIGQYDPSSMATVWDIYDGAPDSPITNSVDGWRGGVSAPGDDVGRWTSIAERGGTYYVSYYDKTNGALKLAIGTPAGGFNVSIVDDGGDSGRYSSIAFDAAGNPVIAYLQMIAADDGSGQVLSSARVAATSSAAPAGPTDWASTEIASGVMLCRPGLCATGTCLENGVCATDTGDCGAACAAGELCYMGSCVAELGDSYVEDMPPALGMYNSLVATPAGGLALVFYDRTTGNLWGAANDGTSWAAPFLIDGYGTDTLGVGDSGIGASLFVDDAGVWHVTYVDGAEETLRYARVEGSTVTREVVDNGATDGTMPNPDGRHIVGDDSNVVVTTDGEIRVVYQDATEQRAMLARRPASGGDWTISIIDAENSTGYWLEQELVGTTSYVGLFYTGLAGSGVRVLNVD